MQEYEVEIRCSKYIKVDANDVREALAHVRKEYPNWTIESAEAVEGEYEGDFVEFCEACETAILAQDKYATSEDDLYLCQKCAKGAF